MKEVNSYRPSSLEDMFFTYLSPKPSNMENGQDNTTNNLDDFSLFQSEEEALKASNLSEFYGNTPDSKNLDLQFDTLLKDIISNGIIEDYSDSYSVLGVNLNLTYNNGECGASTDNMAYNGDVSLIGNLDSWLEETVDNIVYRELLTNSSFDGVLDDSNHETSRSLAANDTDLLNLLPHIAEEKNVKRRSLLYERSVKMDNLRNENCTNGNKAIKKPPALMAHDYTHRRSEDKFFPCSVVNCDRVYSKSSHLKAHLKRHSGEKPFVCNWNNCTWKFSRSDELARHRRSHLGIKPYKCELCERAFARSDHLAKHYKVHKRKMAQCGNFQIKRRIRLK